MKQFFTLCLSAAIAQFSFAQNYGSNQTTGTSEPYLYNLNGAAALSIPSSEVLSSVKTIPFTFSFYGTQVSSYVVSDNGYITFDTGATTSEPNNTSIPDAGGPNNAIYAFWDDLNVISGSGSADEVVTFTYGTAPSRTHVIQWYSVTPVSGTGFVYAAVRLHECGDFDIVLNYGNATGMTATIGCENFNGSAATMVEGPNFDYPAIGSGNTDDIVYNFFWDGIAYDAMISDTDLDNFVSIGNNTVSGELTNNGSATITSYDLHYTIDGGAPVSETVTGVNIAPNGGTVTFAHGTPFNIAGGGENHTICIWADNLNGNADQRTCNDMICNDVFSNLNISAQDVNVVVEEFTGAWCGWCPDGAVVLEDIATTYPNSSIVISIHDGDDMEFNEGVRSGFNVTAYPNGMVDRKLFSGETKEPHSRGAWESNFVAQTSKYTPVEVDLTHTYDASTRLITATVTADFVDYAVGDMRFVFNVVEDNVTGTGSGYDQVNYLNTSSGHPYENAGDPIVGFNHRHVLRANPGGAFGNSGIIPNMVAPNSSYTETFTYTLPAGFDENEISLVGFVAYYSTTVGEREIMNGEEKHLSENVSISENELFSNMTVYPNPANEVVNISVSMQKAAQAEVGIYDIYGKEVMQIKSGTLAIGENIIEAQLGDLAKGVYFVSVRTNEGAITQRLVLQ